MNKIVIIWCLLILNIYLQAQNNYYSLHLQPHDASAFEMSGNDLINYQLRTDVVKTRNYLDSNEVGTVRFKKRADSSIVYMGFGRSGKIITDYPCIVFMYNSGNHEIHFAEPSSGMGYLTNYTQNDVIEILRTKDGYVEFWVNAMRIFISNDTVTHSVYLNLTVDNDTTELYDLQASFLSKHPIPWAQRNDVDITVSHHGISAKPASPMSGAFSPYKIDNAQEGYIITRQDQFVTGTSAIGLSTDNPDDDINTIEYGFLLDGTAAIIENGGIQAFFGSYDRTDIFKIERTQNHEINYYQNGIHLWTSYCAPNDVFYPDVSFGNDGSLYHLKCTFSSQIEDQFREVRVSDDYHRDVTSKNGRFNVLYRCDYTEGIADTLVYNLYSENNSLIAFVDESYASANNAPLIEIHRGSNFIQFDLTQITGTNKYEQYILEIVDRKRYRSSHRLIWK